MENFPRGSPNYVPLFHDDVCLFCMEKRSITSVKKMGRQTNSVSLEVPNLKMAGSTMYFKMGKIGKIFTLFRYHFLLSHRSKWLLYRDSSAVQAIKIYSCLFYVGTQ
jgi:hypothetical protein